jgi:hypothetical protein
LIIRRWWTIVKILSFYLCVMYYFIPAHGAWLFFLHPRPQAFGVKPMSAGQSWYCLSYIEQNWLFSIFYRHMMQMHFLWALKMLSWQVGYLGKGIACKKALIVGNIHLTEWWLTYRKFTSLDSVLVLLSQRRVINGSLIGQLA